MNRAQTGLATASELAHFMNSGASLIEAAKLFTQAAHDVRDELNRRGIACPASLALAAEKARNALRDLGQTEI